MLRARLIAWFSLATVLLLLAVLAFSLSAPRPPEAHNPATINIPAGSSLRLVARDLEAQSLIRSALAFELLAALKGQREAIQRGEYAIASGASAHAILEKLVAGRVKTYRLALIEGQTLQQVFAGFRAHEALTRELEGPLDPRLLDLSFGEFGPIDSSEGLFMPETYEYRRGDSDLDLLRRAQALLVEQLNTAWEGRAGGLPFDTPYEALILASIIERESGVLAERARVAGVFVNRLQRGMRLQSDPTTIYGLGSSYTGALTKEQLRGSTPFNTYRIDGLPPTPIALASSSALQAALAPEVHDYLYFVADGEGGHVFSHTLEQHNAAVQRYREALNAGQTSQPNQSGSRAQ